MWCPALKELMLGRCEKGQPGMGHLNQKPFPCNKQGHHNWGQQFREKVGGAALLPHPSLMVLLLGHGHRGTWRWGGSVKWAWLPSGQAGFPILPGLLECCVTSTVVKMRIKGICKGQASTSCMKIKINAKGREHCVSSPKWSSCCRDSAGYTVNAQYMIQPN